MNRSLLHLSVVIILAFSPVAYSVELGSLLGEWEVTEINGEAAKSRFICIISEDRIEIAPQKLEKGATANSVISFTGEYRACTDGTVQLLPNEQSEPLVLRLNANSDLKITRKSFSITVKKPQAIK